MGHGLYTQFTRGFMLSMLLDLGMSVNCCYLCAPSSEVRTISIILQDGYRRLCNYGASKALLRHIFSIPNRAPSSHIITFRRGSSCSQVCAQLQMAVIAAILVYFYCTNLHSCTLQYGFLMSKQALGKEASKLKQVCLAGSS